MFLTLPLVLSIEEPINQKYKLFYVKELPIKHHNFVCISTHTVSVQRVIYLTSDFVIFFFFLIAHFSDFNHGCSQQLAVFLFETTEKELVSLEKITPHPQSAVLVDL